ncbi:hypothetical protein Mapa_010552 [Marchantia paleacea]|nr:hypothetical protein Mapa_010552 [Marchantia paleacea]
MRHHDGGGVSALEPQLVHTSQEPDQRRPPRRPVRTHRVENRAMGRNGLPQTATASSLSIRAEPASRKRGSLGIAVRDRSPKRLQSSEPRNCFAGVEDNVLANGLSSELALRNHQCLDMGAVKPCDREQDQQDVRERIGDYFPSIHDELGQLCLTRIPRSKIYDMALVCKKWKAYLLGPELYKARRLQSVREDWVFILGVTNVDKKWRAYRPTVNDWVVIPPCPSDFVFDSCDKESMVAGLNLMVLGQGGDGYVVWRFDTIRSAWSTTPKMHTDRCLFGSASFGQFAYFAGGTSRGSLLKSVERYNSETDSWELLPDMNTERKCCSGFVMDGKFHVIGGQQHSVILNSGEVYDPATKTWNLIKDMWPKKFVPSTQVAPPLVAVLNNQLYGINIIENMLMSYDKEKNQWQLLEKVPHRAENTNGWGLGFKAVGDELFVIGGARGVGLFLPQIHAYSPKAEGSERWRFVTDLHLPTSGFIYNCAIMSG